MGAKPPGNVTKLLSALGLHSTRVDRRPALHDGLFRDVYFVELQQVETVTETGKHVETNKLWIREVERGIHRIKEIKGEACLLGIW